MINAVCLLTHDKIITIQSGFKISPFDFRLSFLKTKKKLVLRFQFCESQTLNKDKECYRLPFDETLDCVIVLVI